MRPAGWPSEVRRIDPKWTMAKPHGSFPAGISRFPDGQHKGGCRKDRPRPAATRRQRGADVVSVPGRRSEGSTSAQPKGATK
jgi:hypothetical protein